MKRKVAITGLALAMMQLHAEQSGPVVLKDMDKPKGDDEDPFPIYTSMVMGKSRNKTQIPQIDVAVHTVVPKGCKQHWFDSEGNRYEFKHPEAVFSCIAMTWQKARSKYDRWKQAN